LDCGNQLDYNSICNFEKTKTLKPLNPGSFYFISFLKQSEFSPIYEGPELLHSTQMQVTDKLRLSHSENVKTKGKKGEINAIYI